MLQQPTGPNKQPIGAPANFGTEKTALATYAAMLERVFANAYPTVAFSANLARDAKPPFTAAKDVASFLDANPRFDLMITNIDAFSNAQKKAASTAANSPAAPAKTVAAAAPTVMSDSVRVSLLVAQRLMKVAPSYAAAGALLQTGIHSAKQVYRMGLRASGRRSRTTPTLARPAPRKYTRGRSKPTGWR